VTPQPFTEIWVYLAATPLLGLTLTLVAYQAGYWVYRRAGFAPLLNPVLLAVAMIVAVLAATGTEYRTYFDGAQFVHFLLGPAVVALAVPLAREWDSVKRLAVPIAGGLVAGSLTAVASAVALAWALGASPATTPPATSAPRIGTANRRTLSHSRASGTASATTAGPSRKCTNCAPSKYVR